MLQTRESEVVASVHQILDQVRRVVAGKDEALLWVLAALLSGGHILLEDVPGVGKTTMALSFARALDLEYGRVQFTPDVLPSDVTGYSVPDGGGNMTYRPGGILCNLFLADELNRATSRTQSALLEAMEEGQVTVDGVTHPLPRPFMVLATQNPVDFVGTYPLPEAQMDRFFLRITIGYPSIEEEMDVLERYSGQASPLSSLQSVCGAGDVVAMQELVGAVYCSREVRAYVAQLAALTRKHPALALGVSPRGAIALIRAAQGCAVLAGRDYILPDDVKRMALPVLSHRLILTPEARMKGQSAQQILLGLLSSVPVPGAQ